MEIITIKYTNCGSVDVRLNPDGKTASCDRCYSDFIVEQGRKFGDVDAERAEQISRLRRTMLQLATDGEYDHCALVATDILGMIPGDFMASFCLHYSNKCRHADPRKYEDFIANPSTPMGVEAKQAMQLILSRLELREIESVGMFIDAAFAEDEMSRQEWLSALDQREQEETEKINQYAMYPRDVFICYSTRNESVAANIVDALEKDNRSCWIASRNLREDSMRYWQDIEYAIENCTIFLVLTSKASMHSKDVEHEILYAIKRNKEHFEFKLDNSERTAAFKNYFDGITWVDGVGCTEAQLQKLKERVVQEWKAVKIRQSGEVGYMPAAPNPSPQEPSPTVVRKAEIVPEPLPESADAPNDPSAQYELGCMYDYGQGVPQNYAKAREWYEKAAAQELALAQNNLGFMYLYGRRVPQDYDKALEWFEKAIAKGLASAQNNLGFMYDERHGVPQDYAKAIEWYEKAAVQGLASAQYNLGFMYNEGHGVPQDYAKAREWFEKAAAQGLDVAQYDLGVMYANGYGVPQDYAIAREWYGKAAAQGHANAKKALRNLPKQGFLSKLFHKT